MRKYGGAGYDLHSDFSGGGGVDFDSKLKNFQKGLIKDGFFKYVRHTNYTGEMMLYGSYALLVQHWIPWIILGGVWLGLFLPNMLKKEESLSRYPEWKEYKAQSGMIFPKLF